MSSRGWLVLLLVGVLATLSPWLFFRAEGAPPSVSAPTALVMGISGRDVTLAFADAGAGLREIRVSLVHAEGDLLLADESLPGNLLLGGERSGHELEVTISREQVAALRGDPLLRIVARDWSLFGNVTQTEVALEIDRTPPQIEIHSGLTYVKHGGSGAVAYRLSETTARDGVLVGDVFFRGYPKAGAADGERVALFAIPADAPRDPSIRVVAEDAAGNVSEASWAVVAQYRALPEANVTLSRDFIGRILPRFGREAAGEDGELAAAFDDVNTRIRAENERRIREILARPDETLAVDARLDQLRNSQVTSRFGERRSYFLGGQRISGAIHYGYDLASTARAPITAAGAGRVVHAGDLGIYGGCVLVDHGLGLTTLYGHLSHIEVAVGDRVERGQQLGRSGATGLAGGDHLHFAVLVGEVYVDPIEWWDPKWLSTHVRVALR